MMPLASGHLGRRRQDELGRGDRRPSRAWSRARRAVATATPEPAAIRAPTPTPRSQCRPHCPCTASPAGCGSNTLPSCGPTRCAGQPARAHQRRDQQVEHRAAAGEPGPVDAGWRGPTDTSRPVVAHRPDDGPGDLLRRVDRRRRPADAAGVVARPGGRPGCRRRRGRRGRRATSGVCRASICSTRASPRTAHFAVDVLLMYGVAISPSSEPVRTSVPCALVAELAQRRPRDVHRAVHVGVQDLAEDLVGARPRTGRRRRPRRCAPRRRRGRTARPPRANSAPTSALVGDVGDDREHRRRPRRHAVAPRPRPASRCGPRGEHQAGHPAGRAASAVARPMPLEAPVTSTTRRGRPGRRSRLRGRP